MSCASIPIEQIEKRRWDLCVVALQIIQQQQHGPLDMKKLSITEDEKYLNFKYNE